MAKGINSVQLLGNLGHAPEMRYTSGGKAVTTFSVAVDHPTNSPTGECGTATDWFKIVTWDKLAEHANQYLDRGSKVFVQGRLQTRSWDGPAGTKHYATEIVAEEIIFLSPRPAGAPTTDAPADEEGLPF
jgi:single-strand DNA-binding protein